jgi:hypothetical protein
MVLPLSFQDMTAPAARRASLIVALFLGLAPLPVSAAEDPILSQLAGDWIGRGTFKQSANAEPELVYCKVANRLVDGGSALEQKGRCAVATNSGAIKGLITANGAGTYQGSLESISTKGPATIAGKGSNGVIVLSADFVDRKTRKPGKSTIKLVVADGKYRLVSNSINPATNAEFVASDILFTPQ